MLEVLYRCILAFVSTLGFAIMFNAPRRTLLACGVTGVMGYLARLLALNLGISAPGASFAGAALVGLLSEIFAHVYRLPATVFIVSGFVPLLPGVAAMRAMFQVMSGDYTNGGANTVSALLNTAALAAGIGGLGAAARALRSRSPGNRAE